MHRLVAKVAGPTLLLGSMAAVWVAAGYGPLATPRTEQAATTRDVTPPAPQHPASGTVGGIHHEGDRLLLLLRTGADTAELDLAPGVAVTGGTLADLAAAGARPPHVLLTYGPDGAITAITRD